MLCLTKAALKAVYHKAQYLGTVPGPKNFLVHINDFQTPLPMYKYMDDCNVIEVCAKEGKFSLQECLNIVNDWSYCNDMRINPQQTKEIINGIEFL